MNAPQTPVFISVPELEELLADEHPVHLLDVRWRLGSDDGYERYSQGHLPGAVYVDLDTMLAGQGPATAGRHPLPTEENFTKVMQLWGLRAAEPVVVYDDSAGLSAARAWWLLRYASHQPVYILDGGYEAWVEAGQNVQAGDVIPQPGDATAVFGGLPAVAMEDVLDQPLLLDARAAERYTGDHEPMDPRAGHIPGARNLPASTLLEDGRLVSDEVILELLESGGHRYGQATTAYCGSGVTAAFLVAAAAHAGVTLSLYPGSFSQWSQHPELEVETGARVHDVVSLETQILEHDEDTEVTATGADPAEESEAVESPETKEN